MTSTQIHCRIRENFTTDRFDVPWGLSPITCYMSRYISYALCYCHGQNILLASRCFNLGVVVFGDVGGLAW